MSDLPVPTTVPEDGAPALRRVVGDLDALRAAWEDDHLLSSGLGGFDDVFGLDLLDDLVTGQGLRIPYLRLLSDGAYLAPLRFTHRTGTAGGTADGVADPQAVLREFRRGATIVLRGMVRYCRPLATFCGDLTRELGIPISAGAYVTPPGSRGAGAHYDPMSVIVRQIHGEKHWRLQAPPTPRPRGLPAAGEQYDTPVVAEFTLRAGDSLYLPRGVVHDCWTSDHASVHVTFSGDTPITWTDVLLDRVREVADGDAELRAALPWRFADDPRHLADTAADVLARLVKALEAAEPAELARTVVDTCAVRPTEHPGGSLAAQLRAA